MFESLKRFNILWLYSVFIVLLFGLSASLQGPVQAQDPLYSATPLLPDSIQHITSSKNLFSSENLSPGEIRPISVIVTFVDSFDPHTLEIVSGGHIVYSYENIFNGVSLVLDYANLSTITGLEGVIAVYMDELRQLHTDTSPEFTGATTLWTELGGQGVAGEGIVVGVIDTGVWPEHSSFSDPDPAGIPYPTPSGGPYVCEFGDQVWNPNDLPFTCNNKLIGAYTFLQTYKEFIGLSPQEFNSTRDDNGHGTHVASIAAGNGSVTASILGVERGVISGISPRSHVIAYRACASFGCYMSDVLAAIEQAMVDHVNVLNYSISGGIEPYSDPVELAFLSAYANDIFVATSAGNTGPSQNGVHHRSPWVMTVGASTHTRTFTGSVTLESDTGSSLHLEGVSLTADYESTVVLAEAYGDAICSHPFPAGTFSGQIVACQQGGVTNVAKSFNVAQGGAGGIIIYNLTPTTPQVAAYHLPGIQLLAAESTALLDFLSLHPDPTAYLSGGIAAPRQGDVIPNSSGRGGPGLTLGINKPDIVAPGNQIIAGQTPFLLDPINRVPGQLFQVANGTSTASPHIAGAAALLKQLHPDWTPGQIKSALMTTALTANLVLQDGVTPATPFDYGAGRVNLHAAGDPGLTISATADEFLTYQNELWQANTPGLYLPMMTGKVTVERTLYSELPEDTYWTTVVDGPPDLTITTRRIFRVRAGHTTVIDIKIDAGLVPMGETRHAILYFQSEDYMIPFPITVVKEAAEVLMTHTCDPAVIVQREETSDCVITLTNNSPVSATVSLYDKQPRFIQLVDGSVVGAIQRPGSKRVFTYTGTLAPADPPDIQMVVGTTPPGGFLPLSQLGIPPLGGIGDESMVGFTISPFVYNGASYTAVRMSSNGYVVLGSGGPSDQQIVNQDFPDPLSPNNVIAPFWTDLNPSVGGALRAAIVNSGGLLWAVFEWENVPNYSGDGVNTFQIWLGLNGVEDISIAYGPVLSSGNLGLVTVGAENIDGTIGSNWYINGSGTAVEPGDQLRVVSSFGNPGGTHTITYSIIGWRPGPWSNCPELSSDLWAGISIICFSGDVLPGD